MTDLRENSEIDTFDYNGYKPPKGKSIAHKWIATEKTVYISLDIEPYVDKKEGMKMKTFDVEIRLVNH